MDELIGEFLAESNEALADLDTALIALEQTGGDPETLASIFRMVHTVKGTSGFLGLVRLGHVAHAAETLLGRYRDGELRVTSAGITAILGSLDRIREILAGLAETGVEPAGDDRALIAQLEAAARGEAAPVAAPEPQAAPAPQPALPDFDTLEDKVLADLQPAYEAISKAKGAAGLLNLPRLGVLTHAAASLLDRYRAGEVVTAGGVAAIQHAMDEIRAILAAIGETGAEPAGDDSALLAALESPPADAPEEEPAAPPPIPEAAVPMAAATLPRAAAEDEPRAAVSEGGGASGGGGGVVQAIRVSLPVLDDLMTLASELVLVRNQLMQIARGQESTPFAGPLQRLSRITSDLQEGVMKTRMQPVSAAWSKLPRLVRDLAGELGKRIELTMTGGDTELDRQVLELIRDPLTHMVRNCADHGLERPDVRRAAGKPETGRILLNARHEGGRIVIEITDDGRGIDLARVRARAVERGLASEAEVAAMRDEEVARFIFRAGFSTAEAVTSVSGRGVGMDVVRSNIERIGGTVDLQSEMGRGTTVAIRIPLTLAIVSALVVQAAGERFAVPQAAVVELVRVGPGGMEVEWLDAAPVLRLRGQLLPLVALGPLLGLAAAYAGGDAVDGFVAVLQGDAGRYGLLVNGVFDTEEIVVKPVAPILRDLGAFSGNTILGDGGVIMILDPAGVARMAGVGAGRPAEAEGAGAGETERAQLLLFRAGGQPAPIAVPLGLVARLESIGAESIEMAGGRPSVQYRGGLMPLVPLGPWTPPSPGEKQPVLVFQDGEHLIGLMVDEILDVLEEALVMRASADRAGYLGSAIIAGRATDVLDCAHWLRMGDPGWFNRQNRRMPRLLVVEDSAFFRQIVVPALASAGYDVTAAVDAASALKLRAEGEMFDAVLTDIEMPGMDGYGLLAAIRQDGPWTGLPVMALTSRTGPAEVARGMGAGFTDYVAKFDRDRVLAALARALGERKAA
jgi:two-component system chemotaxis sensor kinase CheA